MESSSRKRQLVMPTDNGEIIHFEQFLRSYQRFQLILRFDYFRFERSEHGFVLKRHLVFELSLILMFIYYVFNFWDMSCAVVTGRPHSQNFAVISITNMCCVRAATLALKRESILRLFSALDRDFPRDPKLQTLLRVQEHYEVFRKRFRILSICTEMCFVFFFGVPLILFILEQKRDEPIHMDHQLLGGWMPFGLRQSYDAYPFVYIYDFYGCLSAVSYIIMWDTFFAIMQQQICMHLDLLTAQILQLDARDSCNPLEAQNVYRKVIQLIMYHQHIKSRGSDFNEVFKLSILFADSVATAAFCLQIYFIVNTSDVIVIIKLVLPCAVLVFLTYEISMGGSVLEQKSQEVNLALYNHNWYEGSKEYRRLLLMWLHYSQLTIKLGGYNMFEVNMEHFKAIMTMAYQLFTFLESRKN